MELYGGVSKTNFGLGKDYLKNFGFLPAIGNLEWSRGYLWYAELDEVPYPFQRNGVIALPLTSVTYEISNPNTFEWGSAMDKFSVPKDKSISTVTIEFIDDEQATMFTFFERWYNSIYNSRLGVLPVTEAAKMLTIYKLKASRSKVERWIREYNAVEHEIDEKLKKEYGRELLVYPTNHLIEQESLEGNPRKYSIEFHILDQQNADYGNPTLHEGGKDGKVSAGSFLGRVADYF